MDKLELLPGKPVIIKTQVGEEYSVVTSSGDASDLLNNVIVKRVGDDIVLLYPNNIEIVFEDFYLVCLEPQGCSINLPAAEGGVFTLTGAELATDLGDGSSLIYVYGNTTTLLAMAKDNDALQSLFNSYDDQQISYLTSVEPVEASSSIGLLSSGILGIGALSGMSGGASSAPEVGSVTYNIAAMLGPLIDNGVGSVVSLFKADGTKLGEAKFDIETQRFIYEDTSSYTGVVIACLQDKDDTADYMDEATVQAKDIDSDLFLVTTVTADNQGQTVSFTITPLSSIAAMQAGVVVADNNVSIAANVETVSSANIAVANAFGLSDINLERAEVKPTIDSTGANTDINNKYGQVLALVSAWEDATNATADGNDTITYFNNHLSAQDLSNTAKAEIVSATDIIELNRQQAIQILEYSPSVSELLSAIGQYAKAEHKTGINAPGLCAEMLNGIEGLDGAKLGNEPAYENFIVSNSSKFSEIATLPEVQSMVQIVNAITNINKALHDNEMPNPILEDYINADVTGVNEGNLSVINEILTSKNTDEIDTSAEIQSVVNSYNTIFNIANGIDDNGTKPEANDYSTIGVNSVNSPEKVSLMGDILDIKNGSDVDSIVKLQTLANIVHKIMQHAENTPQVITQHELESIGITNLTQGRTEDLLRKIASIFNNKTAIDTLSEIQAMVDITAPTISIVTNDWGVSLNATEDESTGTVTVVTDGVEDGQLVTLSLNKINYTSTVKDNTATIDIDPTALQMLVDGEIYTLTANVADVAGNIATTASTSFTVDVQAPTLKSIVLADNTINATEETQVTFTFSEAVSNFSTANMTVENGSIGQLKTDDGGLTYTATYTPAGNTTDLTNMISVDMTNISDTAGNQGEETVTSANYSVDTKIPTLVSIGMDDQAIKVDDKAIVSFTFSEAVSNFSTTNVNVENGSIDVLMPNDDGLTYTTTFTPHDNITASDNKISVNVTGVTDTAGNQGEETVTSANYSVDTEIPTLVSIGMDDQAIKVDDKAIVSFTFSEAVSNFSTTNVNVENGSIEVLMPNNDGLTYTTTFTPHDNITASDNKISVNVTGVTDTAGNSVQPSTLEVDYEIDTQAPSMPMISLYNNNAPVITNFTDSENVITNDSTVSVQNLDVDASWEYSVDGGQSWTTGIGSTFELADDGYYAFGDVQVKQTDTAGNISDLYALNGFTLDTQAPTLSIELADNTIIVTEKTPITFTFSEAVSNFSTANMTVENGSIGQLKTDDGGFTYTATYTPAGNITASDNKISVNVTGVTDTAGNQGEETVTSANYSVDTEIPTLVSIGMDDQAIKVDDKAIVSFTFSEAVSNFSTANVNVENGSIDVLMPNNDGHTYTTTFTPHNNITASDNKISVNVAGVTDTAGNSVQPSTLKVDYEIDTEAPSMPTMRLVNNNNEPLTNFSDSDNVITNNSTVSVQNLDVDASWEYSVNGGYSWTTGTGSTFELQDDGHYAFGDVQVKQTDMAGNVSDLYALNGFTLDTTPPSASIKLDKVTEDDTINASEAHQEIDITGTVDGDVQVGDTVTLTVDSTEFTGEVQADKTFRIPVSGSNLAADNSIIKASVTTTDTADNSTTATVDKSYGVDTTPPSASIKLDKVTEDNTINASEAHQEIDITGTVDGDVQVGDTVTLTVDSTEFTGEVQADKTFRIPVSGSNLAADNSIIKASVTTTDTADNSTTATVDKSYSVDTQAPTLASSSSDDGEEDVKVDGDIVLIFSEGVTVGNGNIVIYSSGGSEFDIIDVKDSSQVTVSDGQVTINPIKNFESSTEYYVQIAAESFEDPPGNFYAGITDSITLNFKTPEPQIVGSPSLSFTDPNELINLNLIKPIIHGGKNYYFLDESGDNNIDTSYYSIDRVTHDNLDTLLNSGINTIATQEGGGGHDGSDDERSVVLNDFTLVLPTVTELQNLFNAVDVVSDEYGYSSRDYWAANDHPSPTMHLYLNPGSSSPGGGGDTGKNLVIFQVI